jgi:hypothetical protein
MRASASPKDKRTGRAAQPPPGLFSPRCLLTRLLHRETRTSGHHSSRNVGRTAVRLSAEGMGKMMVAAVGMVRRVSPLLHSTRALYMTLRRKNKRRWRIVRCPSMISFSNLPKNRINKSLAEINPLPFHLLQKWFNSRNRAHLPGPNQNAGRSGNMQIERFCNFSPS